MNRIFKIRCITNLHVGSGESNFNIIDNEVEKDAVTGYPTVHASGIKGALRDNDAILTDKTKEYYIFGKPEKSDEAGSGGNYKFFDAKLLSRPLRVSGDPMLAYIPVTTVTAINEFIETSALFGCNVGKTDKLDVNFGESNFISNVDNIKIEGEAASKYSGTDEAFLKSILGEKFAICKSFDDYPLPIVARNKLDENGISKNLWYEEFVPHTSTFWMIVLCPDSNFYLDIESKPIQLGANSSTGKGFVTFESLTKAGE